MRTFKTKPIDDFGKHPPGLANILPVEQFKNPAAYPYPLTDEREHVSDAFAVFIKSVR